MAQLFFGRWTDGLHAHVSRVEAGRQAANGPTLTGRVKSLEEHDEARSRRLGARGAPPKRGAVVSGGAEP